MDTSDKSPGFNGSHYDPEHDDPRLTKQHERIKRVMLDGAWRTLREIAKLTGDPEASISAQLRHLRKRRFGRWNVKTEPTGNRDDGLFRYRLLPPDGQGVEDPSAVASDGDRPRLTKSDWRELHEELPLVVAAAEHQGHVASAVLKKLVAYVAWSARPRSYPRRDSNPQSPS